MQHVFEEPSGARWRSVRAIIVASLITVVGLGVILASLAQIPPEREGRALEPVLTKRDVGDRIPVVGTGPLERVLRVENVGGQRVGRDPFDSSVLVPLDHVPAHDLEGTTYVLQRYGYSEGSRRTIALTFDDGPDGEITPQLLDLLERERVPATFFVLGRSVARNPDLVVRANKQGHSVGIHSLTHAEMATVPSWRAHVELVAAERQLRALTGRAAELWRMPYSSADIEQEQKTITGLLRAQRLGYVQSSYDFDSRDWRYARYTRDNISQMPMPDFASGENLTVLLHDGGGPNRELSLAYTERVITEARRHGYTFATMPQMNPQIADANRLVETGIADTFAYAVAAAMYAAPDAVMKGLFWLAIAMMAVTVVLHTILALGRRYAWMRARRKWASTDVIPVTVSVVLAAYNEETVIERTLRSILASQYQFLELLVVDDGSTDATAARVRRVAREDPRVVLVQQPNGGKASALNRAIAVAQGEILVTFDADTIVTETTVGALVEHFHRDHRRSLGGVAGVIRVGNLRRNLTTRWQALEYVSQIGLERSAQDALGAISIIPGACAAWRKTAIQDCGGFASDTLAEDCDLALMMHRHGWRVTQEDTARAYTEAPETVDELLKQRERWTYGTLQAVFKHRSMVLNPRFGALGLYVLPYYLFTLALPLVFLPFVAGSAVLLVIKDGPQVPLLFYGLFMVIQIVQCTVSVALMRENPRLLFLVPLYRLINDPLRAYLQYTSVFRALRGLPQGWNKVIRTGRFDGVGTGGSTPAVTRELDTQPVVVTAVN